MTGVPGSGQIRNTVSAGGSISYGTDGGLFGSNKFLHSGAAVDKVREIILATDPNRVKTAGKAYQDIAARMQTSISTIYDQAKAMSDAWGGKDSEAAMKQMQKMYDEAYEIYDKSNTTGSALSEHAVKLDWYKKHVPGGGAVNGMSGGEAVLGAVSPVGLAVKDSIFGSSDDNAAKEFMQRLQGRTTEANDAFPTDIRNDQAFAKQEQYTPTTTPPGGNPPGGNPPGGGGGGNLPKDPFGDHQNGSHLPKDPFGDNFNGGKDHGGHLPNDPFGNGGGGGGGGSSQLAGFDPSGGGGGGGLGGGDPFGAGGLGNSAGAAGLGSGGGLGAGGGLGGGAGAGGAGMAGGRGMMPMAPGGHGQGEKERERSTWLTEDEDVWGGDGDTAPPLIG